MFVSLPAFAEYYGVTVSGIDNNLYKTSQGIYIETNFCHEYVYHDNALLSYDPYSYNNKIFFSNCHACDMKKLLR